MKVLVFGVFDLLHPGHVYFLDEAHKLGSEIHICLATDEFVKNYKKKETHNNFLHRKNAINAIFPNAIVHTGDTSIGQWSIFKELTPDIIAFGYDQNDLHDSIISFGINPNITKIVFILGYKQDKFKTSLL